MNRFALLALAVLFFSTPVAAQQNMADVIYPQDGSAARLLNSVPPESNRSQVSAVQQELKARGYKLKVDGSFGPKTQAALRKFQKKQGLDAHGSLDDATLAALGLTTF